jgi:dTDP-4-dehydrorhamnose 3,5-epimerase
VDIRKGSPTFGKTYSKVLSAKNKRQLYIPKGFAHGFSVLSAKAEVLYKCDEFYNKETENGIIYNDAELNIDWRIPEENKIISEKDLQLPIFSQCNNSFVFEG